MEVTRDLAVTIDHSVQSNMTPKDMRVNRKAATRAHAARDFQRGRDQTRRAQRRSGKIVEDEVVASKVREEAQNILDLSAFPRVSTSRIGYSGDNGHRLTTMDFESTSDGGRLGEPLRGTRLEEGPPKNQADCGRRAAGSEGRRGPKILRIYRRPEGRRHQDSGGGGLSSRQRIGQARRPDRAAASSPSQTVAMQPNHCSPVCEVHRRETTLCVVPGELPSRRLCGMERRLRVGRGMDPSTRAGTRTEARARNHLHRLETM
ncbi:hypothetical protein HNY73_007332 [Argiope bruennichi]|uniref:Uncharacterized protein n=1 Tax=Argiope bruennichi TaxID=94029 RepID=A0A8T0FG86_ARGBR|nr:hypothetical protein HNY73_007332 [Argiope bruennichi]